jgi:hypothetical protein
MIIESMHETVSRSVGAVPCLRNFIAPQAIEADHGGGVNAEAAIAARSDDVTVPDAALLPRV